MKLLPFWRTFCGHHTTIHQLIVSLYWKPVTINNNDWKWHQGGRGWGEGYSITAIIYWAVTCAPDRTEHSSACQTDDKRPEGLLEWRFSLWWENTARSPAPVAQWLARRTVGRKVWGSNPIRVMWDFSALAGSYPELGVLWAQWEGWNHTAELHPLNGCVFEGVALITWPTLQVPQFPGLVNTGIIMTVSVVCGPVK